MHGARPLRSTRRLQNLTSALPRWWTIQAKADSPTMVSIYDEIGMFGVAAGEFLAELQGISGDIDLHLNSPGGDVFEAIAIYNTLKARKGTVAVTIDGLAASAASFIAQAASPGRLEMAPHSTMMIHDGFAMGIGNAADLRDLADQLDAASDNIAGIYADRTGKPAAYWRTMMRSERWFQDHEAVSEGLADRITGRDGPSNSWDLSVYRNAAGGDGNNGWVWDDGQGSWRFDPDGDGDDDSTPEGDTDHDYFDEDGKQVKPIPPCPPMPKGKKAKAGKAHAATRWLNSDKYKQADRDRMAKSGEAMPDGSYPIADAEDLDNAIHAVGRGTANSHNAIRRHIIKRAAALDLASRIPDNWNADGSLKSPGTEDIADPKLLAAVFSNALGGVNVNA